MKKIIGGKRYDTETAEMVGECNNGYGRTDFNFFEEELYKKKTGEFFLYGSGGPLSKYARAVGNMRYGDEKIVPLTLNEAKEWAERYLDADDYEALFEIEEENSITFSLNLPISLYEKIKKQAEKENVTMKDVVIEKLTEDK